MPDPYTHGHVGRREMYRGLWGAGLSDNDSQGGIRRIIFGTTNTGREL